MGNFWRVVGQARRFPATIAGIIASSLLVALLWGANIGTIYPIVEVAFEGETASDWLQKKIDASQRRLAQLDSRIRAARSASERDQFVSRRRAEQASLASYRRLQPWIRHYAPKTPWGALLLIVVAVLLATLLKNLFLGANLVLVERLALQVTLHLRTTFFRRSLQLDLGTLGENHSTDLMARLTNDMSHLKGALNSLFGRSVREPLKMIACLAGAAYISWRLAIVSLLAAPLAIALIGALSRSIKRANRRALEQMNEMYAVLSETLGEIKIVKAYTMESYESERFDRAAGRYVRRMMRIAFYNALLRPATELMGIAIMCSAILAGGYLVLHEQTHLGWFLISPTPLDRGQLITFFALLVGASDPARKLADVYGMIQRGAAAADRIHQQLDREPRVKEPAAPRSLPASIRSVRFENITFGYDPRQPVLREVDLTVAAGEHIAIVGPNGCGKSTLMNLLLRFFDPDTGRILLDQTPIDQVRLADLRSRIGLVTQQTHLFDGTILDNIRYGRPEATREEVIEAACQAHVDTFVNDLPHGYDTRVGERGGLLSGGQRQRIALARAILRRPDLFVLDEATSQIDPASEQAIHETLRSAMEGTTAFLITHRPSTLDLAHRIVVMAEGRIEAVGTRDELTGRSPTFQRLYHQLPRSA